MYHRFGVSSVRILLVISSSVCRPIDTLYSLQPSDLSKVDGIAASLFVVIVILLLFLLAVGRGGLDDDLLDAVVDIVLPHYGLDFAPLDIVGGLMK